MTKSCQYITYDKLMWALVIADTGSREGHKIHEYTNQDHSSKLNFLLHKGKLANTDSRSIIIIVNY